MRIAYLIMAYDDSGLTGRVIRKLGSPSARFFIHVDRKGALDDFLRAAPPSETVTYLEGRDRITVHWGGYSQVEATLALVRKAMRAKPAIDRFVLLSNADYPIKPLQVIEAVLSRPVEYLHIDEVIAPGSEAAQAMFLKYNFMDVPLLNPRERGTSLLGRLLIALLHRIPRQPGTGLFHKGSQWWALSRTCLEYVLSELEQRPRAYRHYRSMMVPGEILFQSLVLNSPFADSVSHDRARDPGHNSPLTEQGVHYVDWSGPRSSSPRWLNMSDLPNLLASAALFGRKFSSSHSADLVNALDAQLSEYPSPASWP